MISVSQNDTATGLVGGRVAAGIDGAEMYALAAEIFPICRSITGSGVRKTLALLARHIALDQTEVPTGAAVFDWTIPREWTIREAYIEDDAGHRVVDFRNHALHVLNYSSPVRARLPLAELKRHIHTLPAQPTLIPYRTSYYADQWGFCMAQAQLDALPDAHYTAVIDATLADGHLTYGEFFHRGESEDEVLLSAHVCHPAQANDNCSGLSLLAHLGARLAKEKTRYSYRILFAPGTIGALTWLSRNETGAARRIKHGLVLSGVGDGGGLTYKKSRRGNSVIDRVMAHVLAHATTTPAILDFYPYGYDERQYCSPAFNLPVGLLQRSRFGTFPEYHTSADNLAFIAPEHLADSYRTVCAAIDIIESNRTLVNLAPKGEPQLGRRGLYAALGGDPKSAEKNLAMLWVLNLSDGDHSLLDIAERAGMPFAPIEATARLLERHGLLRALPAADGQAR
jgi:aminopeptidase-like protein